MATAGNLDIGSDEFSNVNCSICAKKDKVRNANYYCYDCQKHLCTYCLATHDEFNENHNVVPGLGDDKDVITEKCRTHADELITLYCHQDDELLCRKCRLLEHRKCPDPQNIRESSAELNADPELQNVPEQLKLALDKIKKAIEALDQHVARIQKNGNSFLKDIEDYAKKLLSRIEELREKGKRDVKSKQEEILAIIKQHRQACALTKDEINQCLDKITKSNEWKANMFVLKKKGQKIPQKVKALFTESKSLIEGHQFHFKTDKKMFDSLISFNSLLENVITSVHSRTEERQGNSQVEGLAEKRSEVKAQNRSKHVRMVRVKLPNDKGTCSISSCCHLVNGGLVIADCTNRRLKLVDLSSGKVTKHCDTNKEPTTVCCIGPQEVAVAFASNQLHVYNAVSLTRTRTMELGHDTSKIAYHGGLLYCVAAGWGNILYVHDVRDGRKLQEIRLKESDSRNIYPNITGIAINGSGDRVYLTDFFSGLVCVRADGQRIFNCSEEKLGLSVIQGVTTDNSGHVFVCGCESNNVVKVTEDGHVVGEILSGKDCSERPECLSYDMNRGQLYVGGQSNQILVVDGNKVNIK